MSKPSPPEPPDMTAVADASMEAAQLSYDIAQQQLDWAMEQYYMDKETIDQVVDSMITQQDFATETAMADRERYETIFQPMEDEFLAYVNGYNTPERATQEAQRAQAGVSQQFEAARQQSQQELEAFGLNPADTRYAALDIGVNTSEALASAAAGTQARQNVENTGVALMGEAINIGKGYPAQVAQSQQIAQGAGTTAAGATSTATGTASSSLTAPSSYINAGSTALGTGATALNQAYANEVNAYNAQLSASSGWGSALGSVLGAGMSLIPGMQEGGAIPLNASPSRGGIPDDVPIAAEAGEFVFPRDVVEWKGQEYMYKEIAKIREKKQEMLTGAIPETSTA